MRRAPWSALLLWSSVAGAAGQHQAIEFKGEPLGVTTEAKWMSAFPWFKCSESADKAVSDRVCLFEAADRSAIGKECGEQVLNDADRACVDNAVKRFDAFVSFGGAKITSATARFRGDRLVWVSVFYDPADNQKLTDALTAKYGKPVIESRAVGNLAGARLSNVVASWRSRNMHIENRKFAGRIDRAAFLMTTPEFVVDNAARSNNTAKRNAESL